MKNLKEIENHIHQILRLLKPGNQSEIRLEANGGNSILLVYPPALDVDYIRMIEKTLNQDTFEILDLNDLLISYIDSNKDELVEKFELLQSSLSQIFKSAEKDENDLFNFIMQRIQTTFGNNKIPVMVNSGALYGTRIENIHFMENEIVMNSKLPLIILYPATHKDDNLLFLNFRPASRYRCLIIE